MGLQVQVEASNQREIDAAFASFARRKPDALFVGADPFFTRRVQLVPLAARYALPASYMRARVCRSRRSDQLWQPADDAYRQVGVYTGRILKGEKPADLPVLQPTKFELVINPRPPRRSASTCRRRCSPAPTR